MHAALMQRLLLLAGATTSAFNLQARRRAVSTMSAAASVIVETDATDAVKITIGARTLQRTAGEPLQKALGRLAPKQKKGKKAAPAPPAPPPRLLDTNAVEVDAATPLLEALSLGKWLELEGARLPVALNPPTVVSVECYGEPTAGSPLMPIAELKRASADDVSYRYSLDGEACGTGAAYTPDDAAVGRSLVVEASVGESCVTRDLGTVASRWRRPEHDARVAAIGEPAGIRVVTYNVLADAYRHTWDAGIHTHCESRYTAAERRIPMAIDEVLSYAPSIVALQEIDPRWWERLWLPRLRAEGYDAALVLKSGAAQEGEAIAWRKNAWTRVESREIALSIGRADAASRELTPPQAVAEFLAAHPSAAEAMRRIGTVAQLIVLEDGDGRRLCVANTHLFFAGRATHVRTIQAALIVDEASKLCDAAGASLVVVGDLNAENHDAALRYLLDGGVAADDPDWYTGSTFSWGYASSRRARARAVDAFAAADDLDAALDAMDAAQSGDLAAERRTRAAASLRLVSGSAPTGDVEELIAALNAGETYKTSSLVALFQMRADCGLRRGGLSLAEGELEAAAVAVESLRARAESAAAAGRAAQTALVKAAKSDDVVGIGMRLSHARKLASAYARTEPYTNLAGNDFVATLDWILHEEALRTRAVAPIPALDEVRARHFALPSEAFPSDHVCLVADLEWSAAS